MVKFKDIKCFCINLPESTDRRKSVQLQFDKVGINVEFFDGIKNDDGYIGCTTSHLSILKKAVNDGLEYVCIFEDDVIFADDFHDRINELPNFHLFYLGGHSYWSFSYTKTGYKNIYKCVEIGGTYAIIYSNYAMRWMLENNNEFTGADAFYGQIATYRLNAVCKLPFAVTCSDGYSYVSKMFKNVPNVNWQYEPKWDNDKDYQIEIKW